MPAEVAPYAAYGDGELKSMRASRSRWVEEVRFSDDFRHPRRRRKIFLTGRGISDFWGVSNTLP